MDRIQFVTDHSDHSSHRSSNSGGNRDATPFVPALRGEPGLGYQVLSRGGAGEGKEVHSLSEEQDQHMQSRLSGGIETGASSPLEYQLGSKNQE